MSQDCPDGKERNPKTNRCVKKCKDGKIRNPITSRCIKNPADPAKPKCGCINSTSGERCKNNAKDGLKFCTVHKECKNQVKPPRKSAKKSVKKQ